MKRKISLDAWESRENTINVVRSEEFHADRMLQDSLETMEGQIQEDAERMRLEHEARFRRYKKRY